MNNSTHDVGSFKDLSHVLSDFLYRKHFPFFVILIVRTFPALCNFSHGKQFPFFLFVNVRANTRQSNPVPWLWWTGASLLNCTHCAMKAPLEVIKISLNVVQSLIRRLDFWRVWEEEQRKQTQLARLSLYCRH